MAEGANDVRARSRCDSAFYGEDFERGFVCNFAVSITPQWPWSVFAEATSYNMRLSLAF